METLDEIKEFIDNLQIKKAAIGGFSKEHVFIVLYQVAEKYQDYIKTLKAQIELQNTQLTETRNELAAVRLKLPKDVEEAMDRNEEMGVTQLDQIREMKKLKEQNVSYIEQVVQLKDQVQEDNRRMDDMKRRISSYEEQFTQMHIRNQDSQHLIQDLYRQIEEFHGELQDTKIELEQHKQFLANYYTECIDKQSEIIQTFATQYNMMNQELGQLGQQLIEDAGKKMELARRAIEQDVDLQTWIHNDQAKEDLFTGEPFTEEALKEYQFKDDVQGDETREEQEEAAEWITGEESACAEEEEDKSTN